MTNKYRFLSVLEILIKYSDENHYLSTNQIIEYLKSDYGFEEVNRKTIYNDIANLIDIGYDIDTNNGYCLASHDLSLSEIKIIEDTLMSNKSLDDENTNKIIQKIHDKTSIYNQKLLSDLSLKKHKKPSKTYFFIGLLLETIAKEEILIIKTKNTESEIIPYLLYLSNGYYYLYYAYLNKDKIYHIRLDHIENIKITNRKHHLLMRFDECQKIIQESVNSYSGSEVEEIKLEVIDNHEFVINHILDNFDNAIINQNKNQTIINIKISISPVLFSKLTLYQNKIKILSPNNVIMSYKKFINDILNNY